MFDFKALINALFHRHEQEGVNDLKSATQMVLDLPQNQTLTAQIEIIKALRQLNANEKISVRERFQTVDYLDSKARTLQQHLLDIYHDRVIEPDTPPRQVIQTIVAFWNEMGIAYRQSLRHYLSTPTRAIGATQLQQFTLRGLAYFSEQVRWSYLRYLKVDESTWRNLNRFFLHAEKQGFLNTPLAPYPEAPATSAASLYAQTMMLAMSSPDKLQPDQINLLVEWLWHWSSLIEISDRVSPHYHLFAINVTTATAPRRLRRDMMGDAWRYGASEKLVETARNALDRLANGEAAENLGMPPESSHPANIDLLRRLVTLWSRDIPAPVRRHERIPARKPVAVIRGLDAVISHLRREAEQKIDEQRWTVANESASGIGVQINASGQEALKVGEIIGFVNEEHPQGLTIGVIRRISRERDGAMDAGIETLSKSALVVELAPLTAQEGVPVLYSPDSSKEGTERFLLVPEGSYTGEEECKLAAQGRAYHIRLAPARERTPKAAVAGFSVLGKL